MARLMLAVLAGMQGIAACALDLNRTHATNSLWPGHARFHLVWQTLTALLAAAVEVALIWCSGPAMRARFYLAAILTATSLIAFTLAFCFRGMYGGTLRDPNGIPPLRLRILARTREVDGNALAVVAGWIVLGIAVMLFRHSSW